MMTDCKRAVPFLTQHRDLITASKVVSQLLATGNKCDSRYFLHLYLLSLFEANPHAGRDFHDMQVCGKRIKFILENAFTLELVLFLTFGVMGRLNQKRLMGWKLMCTNKKNCIMAKYYHLNWSFVTATVECENHPLVSSINKCTLFAKIYILVDVGTIKVFRTVAD